MLAATLRRNRSHRTFENLEQGLLHTLARNVAGNRRVLGFARNLVDFIDVDDARLGALDVEIGSLKQLQKNVFDVFADVARLGQRGGIGYREWHV